MSTKKLSEVIPLEIKDTAKNLGLIAAKPIISVRSALKTMADNNITSLPIYSHVSEEIVNIVNLVDILNYIIKEAVADEKLPTSINSERIINLDKPIEIVMTLDSDRESYRIFKSDANEGLHDTLTAFSKGVHRSLVIDYTGKINPYILTQTDIIKYVYKHPESVPDIDFNLSLKSLGLFSEDKKEEVVVGYVNETALNVYRRMAFKNLIGIPIVDRQLFGNLSVSDLRGLSYKSIDHLVLPVLDFLKLLPNSENILNPKTATYDTSLKEVIEIIVENHIHQYVNALVSVIATRHVMTQS
ncbi:13487_t:CDS:2 [Entrophospora sp. SA101]|nr:13487_t:CDS:2 [Entrophospora sp. SA101]